MYRRQLLALVGIGGSSGCLRLVGSGNKNQDSTRTSTASTSPTQADEDAAKPSPTGTPTPTETPTESPTESPTPVQREPEFPLGLSESGVTGTLFATHVETLKTKSFRSNVKKIDVDDANIWRNRTYRHDKDHAVGSMSHEGPISIYRSPGTGLWREELNGGNTYGEDRPNRYFHRVLDTGVGGTHFQAPDWGSPEVVRAEFPGRFKLTTTELDEPEEIVKWQDDAEVLSFEGTLIIDERGFISKLDTIRTYRENGSEETDRYIFSITDFGEVSIKKPSWIETAREQAPSATAEFVDDRTLVRLDHESGTALRRETTIRLEAGLYNTIGDVRLSESMDPGQTAYLYHTTDGETKISMGSKPADNSLETLSQEILLRVTRGGLRYFNLLDVG